MNRNIERELRVRVGRELDDLGHIGGQAERDIFVGPDGGMHGGTDSRRRSAHDLPEDPELAEDGEGEQHEGTKEHAASLVGHDAVSQSTGISSRRTGHAELSHAPAGTTRLRARIDVTVGSPRLRFSAALT